MVIQLPIMLDRRRQLSATGVFSRIASNEFVRRPQGRFHDIRLTDPSMSFLIKLVRLVWASPNTLIGLLIGLLACVFGTRAQLRHGCLEFYGGLVTRALDHIPPGSRTAAMTLGHTILGRDRAVLDRVRAHEHVHVRQCERWGPFFLPAYLGCSLILWLRRRDPYLDNPFEVEAYAISDPRIEST